MAQVARSGLIMLDPRESQFWQTAVKSGLIASAKLEECWQAIPPEKRTAEAIDRRLARHCVNSGLITMWQAQQILTGRQHGLRIDRYVLQDLIGQGGMGRVYLARDTRLSRLVALKILSKERMSNERAVRRFRREGKVGAQLQHENLVRVYDEGEVGGMPYLVLEYISGRTVLQMINEQGRLAWSVAAELARQVSLGLEHLHQKGLLHRDVNPANIMVDRDGTAKLTDLGLAIDLDEEDEERVTRDGATVGTFDYISPEQARNPREIDVRSDIYSLGCSLYHMIAGRVPFPAPSLPEKLLAHQSHAPEPLSQLVAGVPEELDAVVRKMMSKLPDDRYPRPSAVARALAPFATRGRPFDDPHTPAGGALNWVDSAVAPQPPSANLASNGAGPATVARGQAVSRAQPAPSGSVDFQLDYGPAPSLSESLSSSRSRSSDSLFHHQKVWVWIGLATLACLAAWTLWPRENGDPPRVGGTPSRNDGSSIPKEPQSPEPPAGISVNYLGGERSPSTTFPDAVSRALARRAEIVVSGLVELNVKESRQLVSGDLLIRGEKGTRPTLRLVLDESPQGFLRATAGTLRLLDLLIEVVVPSGVNAPRMSLFEARDAISIEHCAFSAGPGADHVVPVGFDGRRAEVLGSWFDGFRSALNMRLHPNSEAEVRQSIFAVPASARAPNPAWLIALSGVPGRGAGTRKVTFERCTFCGPGLVRLTGFGANAPLDLKLVASVADAGSLVLWDNAAEAFPAGVTWSGSENLYDLLGPAWVVGPPDGTQPIADAPHDLATWCRGPVAESATRVADVRFVREPAGSGQKPGDYALFGEIEPRPGADPTQVAARGEER